MGEVNFIHNTVDVKGHHNGLNFFSPSNWGIFRVWNNIIVTVRGHLIQLRTPYRSLPNMKGNLFYTTSGDARYLIDTNYNDAQQFRTGDYMDFVEIFRSGHPQCGLYPRL